MTDLIFRLLGTLIASLFIACAASTTESGGLDPGPIEEAQVVRVIDGDTLEVLIAGTKHRVRLFGVDTPERGERCYEAATERTRHLSGDMVRIESGPRSEDRYGRLLFYLYTRSTDGKFAYGQTRLPDGMLGDHEKAIQVAQTIQGIAEKAKHRE